MNHFDVAAGILRDASGRVLVAERLGGGPYHGMWEFPGGKIGQGETAAQALTRELAEEIGVIVTQYASFMNLRHEYEDRIVTIEFFIASAWNGEPIGCEGQALRWVAAEELHTVNLLPADEPVIAALRSEAASGVGADSVAAASVGAASSRD